MAFRNASISISISLMSTVAVMCEITYSAISYFICSISLRCFSSSSILLLAYIMLSVAYIDLSNPLIK